MSFQCLDQGRMTVAEGFLPWLRGGSLDSFEAVMACAQGTVVRDFPGRRTTRLELRDGDGHSRVFYLKRYSPGYLSPVRRLLRAVRWPGAGDEARREWEMIHALREIGIQTARPVATGARPCGGVITRSFLMTEEIADAVEGDRYARSLPGIERRQFLRRVALLAGQLHAAGFVHKDFYLCHVLVRPRAPLPEMFLIDLQRVVKPCCLRRRWIIKDLAALAYSALKSGASRADLRAAFRDYRGGTPPAPGTHLLARDVLQRVAWLRTRRPRHDPEFQQLA